MKDLKRILKFTRPYRLDFSLAIFFVVIETSFELIIPMIMAGILDVGVAGRDLNYIFFQRRSDGSLFDHFTRHRPFVCQVLRPGGRRVWRGAA